jgi:hypothetical protein
MSTWEEVRHKRDVSSVPRVTALSRNCANSHPKDPKTAPTLATRTDYLLVSVQRTTGDVVVTPTGRHLDATVVFESIRLIAVQRCVDSCGQCRRNCSKESHQFCERPNTAFGATDVRQSVCKRNAVERSGLHLWVISRR